MALTQVTHITYVIRLSLVIPAKQLTLNVAETITPAILRRSMKSTDGGRLVIQIRLKVTADVWHPSAKRLRKITVTFLIRMTKSLRLMELTVISVNSQ